MATPIQRRRAIQSIESGGNYQAIGPTHPRLGRALGAYQIMEANIGPWSREVLGREVTPEEFLESQEIQDAIFDGKFGGYVERFGEEGAAQAWFAGPGGVGKTQREDVLGTNVGDYGKRFLAALGADVADDIVAGGGDVSLSGGEGSDPVAGSDVASQAADLLSQFRQQQNTQQQTAAEQARDLLQSMRPKPLQAQAPAALERIAQPPSISVLDQPLAQDEGAGGFDIAAGAVQPFAETLGAVGRSLTGRGPSPSAQALPESIPIFSEDGAAIPLSEGFRETVGPILDVGLGAASGLGALYAGGVGAAADIAESLGMSKGSAERLARDLTAAPEAFAGSPGIAAGARGAIIGRQPQAPASTVARQAAQRVEPPVSAPAATAAREGAEQAAKAATAEETKVRRLIARAAANNLGARQELAELARVNAEAAEAAQRLGMDIPADVFADNALVQQASGIVRAVKGSDAAVEWEDTFRNAQTRAAEIMRQEGATLDLSMQSENVRSALRSSIDTLRDEGGRMFDQVAQSIPTGQQVAPTESIKLFNQIATELGGTSRLTPVERKLFKAITNDEGMTYAALMREKEQIGRAAFRNQGPYADMPTATARRIYNALSEDQRNFVEAVSDSSVLKNLDRANSFWSQAKDLEDRLIAGFGKDGEGSIASKLTSALTQGSKGDIRNLNTVISVIPEPLRKEALLTGIETLSQGRSGQGGFSFPNYAKLYRGLRQNNKVFAEISKELGPDTTNMLRDLFEVSVRMDRAAQNVPKTGLANQALIGESLLARVLDSSAGTAAKSGLGAIAGQALIPVPGVGAGVGAAAGASLKIGGKRAKAAGQLFRSEDFQRLAIEAARKGQASPANVRAVVKSQAYKKWARTAQIENPEQWLLNALAAQTAAQTVETQNVR